MTHRKQILGPLCAALLLATATGCSRQNSSEPISPVFDTGRYPSVAQHKGMFHYIMQPPSDNPNRLFLYSAPTLEELQPSGGKLIFDGRARGMQHMWSPEIYRFDGKWHIYFEADDGNTDNHQIYVLVNPSDDPQQGDWTLQGPIITNAEWNFGIHPSVLTVGNRRYMLWSGWEHRRTETETQCIFIAEMDTPLTLKSQRVLISRPEYEWERQWINPDGSRSAYPIFVNENPVGFLSPDGKKVIVGYSASGVWTLYRTLGCLWADANSDLLNPSSWHKLPEPQFTTSQPDSLAFGASNITVFTHPSDGRTHVIYEVVSNANGREYSSIKSKPINWDTNSLPQFGSPK